MNLDPFELFKLGLDVDFLYVRSTGWPCFQWVHNRLPPRYHAAAYQEAMKCILNGTKPPFAIPVVFKAAEVFPGDWCCL